jgi:hypothetical protein
MAETTEKARDGSNVEQVRLPRTDREKVRRLSQRVDRIVAEGGQACPAPWASLSA